MSEIRTPPATDRYREEYERIFGANRPKTKSKPRLYRNTCGQLNCIADHSVCPGCIYTGPVG